MSRRKTVKLNLEVVLPLIKEKCRSNVVFCERMGRPTQKTWVTGWSNKPKPKNPPSPEEAAKMCILLETTPEVILLNKGATEAETAELQADIALVRDLLDQQDAKKAPTEISEREDLCPTAERIVDILKVAPQAELDKILGYVEFLQSKWGEKK